MLKPRMRSNNCRKIIIPKIKKPLRGLIKISGIFLFFLNERGCISFRVVLSEAKDVSRKPVTRSSRYASLLENRLLSGFRVKLERSESLYRENHYSVFSIRFVTRRPILDRFSSSHERSEWRIEKTCYFFFQIFLANLGRSFIRPSIKASFFFLFQSLTCCSL